MIRFLSRGAESIFTLSRPIKQGVALLLDVGVCLLSVWLAFYLSLGAFLPIEMQSIWPFLASILLAIPIFITSGLYRTIFRYGGMPEMMAVVRAMLIYSLAYAIIFTFCGVESVPRTIGLIQPLLLFMFVGASRVSVRIWLGSFYSHQLGKDILPKVLIYGAGSAGRQLASAMVNSNEMRVVGFLDDDERLHGHVLNGLPIFNPSDLSEILVEIPVTDVLLALPSVIRQRRNEILNSLIKFKLSVRTLPGLSEIAMGKVSTSDIHDLDIDDLLGRDPVNPNHTLLGKNIINKVVLVTGAGGSIGSEICRQILKVGPVKLLLVEHSEFALYAIHQELEKSLPEKKDVLVPLLASIQDFDRVKEIMSTWSPDTVYHAAAYKHVPLVEHNPTEGIKNNVLGTLRTAQAAVLNGVSDFVLISTDKAVRPTNVMGATKRLAEMILQGLAASQSNTKFSMVRFGNVLGSSGSVVPKFRQQIRDGGPISLTHPEVTRYFMTIAEAAQLVIQAGAMSSGGEVFILDMGESVKIIDIARRIIVLSGLSIRDELHPNGDIEIKVTGLRPGEKLFEELLISGNPSLTSHPKILKGIENFIPWNELVENLKSLETALAINDVGEIRSILAKLVPGYIPNSEIVDWIFVEKEAEADRLDLGS